jgi:hypothetical protein
MPKEVRAYWLLLLYELNCSFRILYNLRGIRGIALHIDTGFVTPLAPTYVILLLPSSRCSDVMDDLETEISDALLALIMHAFLLLWWWFFSNSELRGVVAVIPDRLVLLHTTHSWDFLGVASNGQITSAWSSANLGADTIIGCIDTGNWNLYIHLLYFSTYYILVIYTTLHFKL